MPSVIITVWFGVLMLIALETGLITPPFGVTLFVMKGVAPPEITMADIWRAVTPYVIVDILCIALVLVMPVLSNGCTQSYGNEVKWYARRSWE